MECQSGPRCRRQFAAAWSISLAKSCKNSKFYTRKMKPCINNSVNNRIAFKDSLIPRRLVRIMLGTFQSTHVLFFRDLMMSRHQSLRTLCIFPAGRVHGASFASASSSPPTSAGFNVSSERELLTLLHTYLRVDC